MDHVHKHYTATLVLFSLYFVNCQQHMENVALSGACSMTEKFPNTGDCTEAIDNVTNLYLGFTLNGETPNCIHTTNVVPGCQPFWQVVLKEDYTITNITIFNRAGFSQRLTYTDVTVNGTLCKSFGSDVSSIVQNDIATFQCSSPIRGRTVNISRQYPTCTNDTDFTLNLCEVQVWVCSKGWYGNDCNTPCSGHCSNKAICDRYNGSCPTECASAYYGETCQEECGHCFGKEACNKENGHCLKCEPGWELPQCKRACNDSYYGQNCTAKCGHCSQEEICNKTDGSCLACEPGWERPLCIQAANCAFPLPNNSDGPPVGVGIGSAVGGAAVVVIAEVLFYLAYRWRKNSQKKQAADVGEQSVSEDKLTGLRVHHSLGPEKKETHSDEAKQLETTYDKLERNTLYENTKEHSVYTGLSIDIGSEVSTSN